MHRISTKIIWSEEYNELCILKRLHAANPMEFEVPLSELFEEWLKKPIKLIIEKDPNCDQITPIIIKGILIQKGDALFIGDKILAEIFKPFENQQIALWIVPYLEHQVLPAVTTKPIPDLNPKMSLWYTQPAGQWVEALPIGNGHFGGMVFGNPINEKIQLNEDTVWYGGPRDRVNPDGKKYLEKIRLLLLNGKQKEAEELTEMAIRSLPPSEHPYQPLDNLEMQFTHPNTGIKDYQRGLDLSTGICYTQYSCGNVQYIREYFCSSANNVMIIRLTASQSNKITFRARFLRHRPFESSAENRNQNQIYAFAQCGPGGVHYRLGMHANIEDGTVKTIGENLLVSNASTVTLIMAAETTFRHSDLKVAVDQHLDRIVNIPYATLKQNHLSEYQEKFSRTQLIFDMEESRSTIPTDVRLQRMKMGESDPELIALYFQYGRYLLMSSSRPGSMPANLQGIWNDSLTPPWESKYTININIEMNYWLSETTNLPECHLPLFDHMERMYKRGKKVADELYGCRGWVAHHNTDLWGDCAPTDRAICSTWPLGAAWFCLHLWEHYLFNPNPEFLLKRAYPLMKEAAIFFIDYLFEGPHMHLYSGPSVSPENKFQLPDGTIGELTMEAQMDAQIIRELFSACIQAANILQIDSDLVETFGKMLPRLIPLQIGKDGRLLEWGQEYLEPEPGHRHMSHLFALHPGTQISVDQTPELARAAQMTLAGRMNYGGGHTGWSCAWIINFYARLRDPLHANLFLETILTHSTYPNLFDSHPPFQIDGNFGATAAIAEMLIQSHEGEIFILPALPITWPSGEIKGLRARGSYEVSLKWKDGIFTSGEITANQKGTLKCRMHTPFILKQENKEYHSSNEAPYRVQISHEKGTKFNIIYRSKAII
jgi:alpha-L-fucosidase 2